jgi:hypothetical protein
VAHAQPTVQIMKMKIIMIVMMMIGVDEGVNIYSDYREYIVIIIIMTG